MYSAIIIVLLQLNCGQLIPPTIELETGKGLWQNKSCEWVQVPCPGKPLFYSPINTIRLPAYCKVYAPKIAYPIKVDAEVRKDLSASSVTIQGLRVELDRCRTSGDLTIKKLKGSIETVNDELKDCIDLSKLQTSTTLALQSQVLWTKVFAVLGITATALLGVYVF